MGDDASRDLFFWALFHDRFDLAVYLCSKTWVRQILIIYIYTNRSF